MEKLEVNMDDGSSPSDQKQEDPQETKRRNIQGCVQMLLHAGHCQDTNCLAKSCKKMKRVIQHTKICKRKINGDCPICKQLIALCCYHAKNCHDTKCSVPFCLVVKSKLKQQQLQHRFQQAQLARRRLTAMNTSSTVPSGTLLGNSSMGVLAGGAVGQAGVMGGQPGAVNMVQEEAAGQQASHAGYPGGKVTPLGVIGGQPQVMARPPIGPIGPSHANLIPTIDQESLPGPAGGALLIQARQQLRHLLESPNLPGQQQRIVQLLQSNPLLMAEFIIDREVLKLKMAEQAAQQEQAEQAAQQEQAEQAAQQEQAQQAAEQEQAQQLLQQQLQQQGCIPILAALSQEQDSVLPQQGQMILHGVWIEQQQIITVQVRQVEPEEEEEEEEGSQEDQEELHEE